jgi:hypothetical protein
MRITAFLLMLYLIELMVVLGLNYRQLYSAWAIQTETTRLSTLAENAPLDIQNPLPMADLFHEELSPDFWKYTIINGSGKVSNDATWHSAALNVQNGLTISHFPDPDFDIESAEMKAPAAGRYNNVSLISDSGSQPSPFGDIVLKFSARVSKNFYGTAGVIVQPAGTLKEDGTFTKPFDMFGFSVAGQESSILGNNGPLCYLALNWMPVKVDPLHVDVQTLHDYEIRLQWIDKTKWLGTLMVDNAVACEMTMPSFGSVEIHVWSDNFHVLNTPRRWWEIAPSMDLSFLDGGDKQFHLETIEIFEEPR